ncbi:iron complex transport system ATP-binding protein [Sinobacterium caligoides]|uniref:Iron complex transport system ATP-binding protein n=1 Tax=Sinobacterium caligoides TaxID=933926 RepID=A0A3N2DKL9_9GAMM|nr:heme ABC transporter ATP-binding protein [Sinobacterium caligoides]ROS00344.1 iron complex transport system ATP-binding protein [Sinobacterium caligoides]
MLSVSQLSVSVADKTLLDIDNFSMSSGEMVAILGRNGAGKSTFFKAISGDVVSHGQRLLHEQSLAEWSGPSLARHLAVLPQASQLSFPFTAQEVAALGLIPLTINTRQGERLVRDMLERTDTLRFAERPYTSLSGGERQRVHLARVLVQLAQAERPPLLLLDEPTSAQDLAQQHQILQLCKDLCTQQDYGVLVILHDLNLSLRYCDSVGLLESGKMDKLGRPSDVLTPDEIDRQWGYRPERLVTASGNEVYV